MTFCHIVSTIGSFTSCFYSLMFCLLGSRSTQDFVYCDSVHSKLCLHENLLTKDGVHSQFCPIWIVLTFCSVYQGVCPPGCLSTWNLAPIALYQLFVRSIVDSANVQSCLLGVSLHGFLSTCNASTFESSHIKILPTQDCVHYWFCPLWILPMCGSV